MVSACHVKGKGRLGKPTLPPAGNSVRHWVKLAHPVSRKAAPGEDWTTRAALPKSALEEDGRKQPRQHADFCRRTYQVCSHCRGWGIEDANPPARCDY